MKACMFYICHWLNIAVYKGKQ